MNDLQSIVKSMLFQVLSEGMNTGVILLDRDGRIQYWNRWIEQHTGVIQEKAIGQELLRLFPEITDRGQAHYLTTVREKNVPVFLSPYFHQYLIRIANSDSSHTPHMYQKVKIFPVDLTEKSCSTLIFIEDITDAIVHEREMTLLNKKLTAELDEKKILLREVHHRVKNNLQIICSLIRKQMNAADSPLVTKHLEESLNRVMSISFMHEELYRSKSLASVDFKQFVYRTSQHLFAFHNIPPQQVQFIFEGDVPQLAIDQALPCSLITNELLTNSIKYAFPDGRKGQIRLMFEEKGDTLDYHFFDNGPGIPRDILDREEAETLGLHLIELLAKNQLEANCGFTTDNGTSFRMRFKKQVADK